MRKKIDCLFIGHNQLNFSEFEKYAKSMGVNSDAYRDLNLTFIQHDRKLYTASEIFSHLYYNEGKVVDEFGHMSIDDTFNTAIAYLGTYLSRRGFSIDYIKSFQNYKEELEEKLNNSDILTIAIPSTYYLNAMPIIEIIAFIKKYNKAAKIIIGGPFVATNVRTQSEMVLQYTFKSIGADFFIFSPEGEGALAQIIHSLKNNLPFGSIPNIYYFNFDKRKYVFTSSVQEENDLETNTVDWELFKDELGRFINIRTAKSCPFSCSFCSFPPFAGKYRMAGIEYVEKELNRIRDLKIIKGINIIDDTFNVPQERFKDILKMMIKNKYDFKWYSFFRCQYADKETVELMKESGCQLVLLGIESGNQNILKNMNKSATVEQLKNGIELLNEYGIVSVASFITGFPGDTYDTYLDSFNFIEETKPTFFRSSMWFCDPISPVFKLQEKYKLSGAYHSWVHATMDSVTAHDLSDRMFKEIKNSIWIKNFELDYTIIFQMILRGLSLEQIKTFMINFNNGIKEKLDNPANIEVSKEILDHMRNAILSH